MMTANADNKYPTGNFGVAVDCLLQGFVYWNL